MRASLASLGLGALTLTPAFAPDVTEYTASTSNNSNTVAAVGEGGTIVSVTVNDEPHTSGTAAIWEPGENVVKITVEAGASRRVYVVTVTKRED